MMTPLRFAVPLLLLVSCAQTPLPADAPADVRIVGSETFTTTLAPRLVAAHLAANPARKLLVQPGGTGVGFRALLDGKAEIAAASRPPTPAEQEQAKVHQYNLNSAESRHLVGLDVIAVAVHPESKLGSLTYDQVIGIFCTREIQDWSALGLDPGPIRAVVRPAGSGTRAVFEDFFCGPKGLSVRLTEQPTTELLETVKTDRQAISFVSLSEPGPKVVALAPSADAAPMIPSGQAALSATWPLIHEVALHTAGTPRGPTAEFLAFVTGPEGQKIVAESGFVPAAIASAGAGAERPLRQVVYFDSGDAAPTAKSLARATALAAEITARGGASPHVVIEGYTDNEEPGGDALAAQRAEAVKAALQPLIPGAMFEVVPRGTSNPIAPNSTPFGRQHNRRVLVFVDQGGVTSAPVGTPEAPE